MISLTMPQIIGRRLMRNHLVVPVTGDKLVDVVRDTCGIQAQVPAAAELGLSARVEGITRQDVRDALLEKRTLVRTTGPRSTQHILPADELPLWIAAMKAGIGLRKEKPHPWNVSIVELRRMIETLKNTLDGLIMTREELAEKVARQGGSRAYEPLRSQWSELIEHAFFEGVVIYGPDRGSEKTFVRADQWTGSWEELDPRESIVEICRRYISAYGPVTHSDFAKWFWIEPAASKEIFDSIQGELEGVKLGRRQAWIMAADADGSWDEVEGNLRLVPQYDCYVLGSYPREPIVSDELKAFLWTLGKANYEGAVGHSLILIDGIVAGVWQRQQRGKRMEVRVLPVTPLSARHREQIDDEVDRLARFLGTKVECSIIPPA
jgi:hypothetical protein